MKYVIKFTSVLILFMTPIVFFYGAKTYWLLKDNKYKSMIYGNEVYKAIEKSKKKTKHRKLILGDSTANQFYNCKKEDPHDAYSLTSSQAIGMIGQYILLSNYLNAGNRPDTVYLVYTPLSFWDNLDQVYTYHYFLKPFYYEENKPLMTKTVMEQIRKIPKYGACHIPLILTTGWAPDIQPQERHYSFLSPVSTEYLHKMDSLSREYQIDFEIIPTYVATHWQDSISHFNQKEYTGYSFDKKIEHYLSKICYLPDSSFIDEIHLKHPTLYKHRIDALLNLH